MSKNGIFLSSLALVLAVVYALYFTDWFRDKSIKIIPTIRVHGAMEVPLRAGMVPVYPVAFSFQGKHQFTTVKVVQADDMATNKYPHPLWHLISDHGSKATQYLIYGKTPAGMKPAAPGLEPEPLEPNIDYVLLLEANGIAGQTNFNTRAFAAR